MKVEFLKRQRMTGIGIGHSYVPFDYVWGKSHASHMIECHFIKWTMTIAWGTSPNPIKKPWNPADGTKYAAATEAQNRHRI